MQRSGYDEHEDHDDLTAHEALVAPGVAPAADLLGSGPLRPDPPSRPRLDDDDDDTGNDPEPEPDPDAPVTPSTPDLAFAVRNPLTPGQDCVDADLEDTLGDAVRAALRDELPDADVQAGCVRHGDRSATTVGVWARPTTTARGREARRLGLLAVDLLTDSQTIGVFINAAFIRGRVAAAYDAAPKRYGAGGDPDPDGPIHLTGHTVHFSAPDRATLEIRGYDERPWPDVSFTITVQDTLVRDGSRVTCETAPPALETDESWLNAVTFVATAILVSFAPYYAAVQDVRDVLGAHPFGDHPLPELAGPACAVALAFLRDEVAIPGGRKLVIWYSSLQVTSGGIFAGGAFILVARDPRLVIHGPRQLIAEGNGAGAISASYRVTGSDLRGNVAVRWTANGGRAVTPTRPSTRVGWLRPTGSAGDTVRRQLTVRARDEDGLIEGEQIDVEIHLVEPDPEPSICDKRPWLPQCREEPAIGPGGIR